MDNYFVDRDKTPKDETGAYDYEVIDALNRPLLNAHLTDLIAGKEVQIPHFDFKAGRSFPGEVVKLLPGQLIVLEGNPWTESPAVTGYSSGAILQDLCFLFDTTEP